MTDDIIVSISEAEAARVEALADEPIIAATESDEIIVELQEAEPIQAELDEDIIQVLLMERGQPGRGIQSITKTATAGLVDTYTILYTDNTTSTFNVTNGASGSAGRGIANISKTATAGLVDTYTITYTDGTTAQYYVTNGAKGDPGEPGTTTWSGITDKPATFPPAAHNHNDVYYTKNEINAMFGSYIADMEDLATGSGGEQ